MINVPLIQQIRRVPIVGRERAPPRVVNSHGRHERTEIPGSSGLANEDNHSQAQFLEHLLRRRGLVVRTRSRADVGL